MRTTTAAIVLAAVILAGCTSAQDGKAAAAAHEARNVCADWGFKPDDDYTPNTDDSSPHRVGLNSPTGSTTSRTGLPQPP